jgi:hypothetical protein
MRSVADAAVGDTVTIEKATPVPADEVAIKPIEEILPGVSTRVAEYIPFALKDNPLVTGEWMRYTFDETPFVFQVVDVQPHDAEAVAITKGTKFTIAPQTTA